MLFLLLAAAILYGCVRLVLSVARNSLHPEEREARQPAVTASPLPTATPDTARSVAAIRTPFAESSPTPETTATPAPSPSSSPVPETPTPAPTMPPVSDAPALAREQADLLLIGMDSASHPDWIAVVQIRDRDCRILSVPRNTLVTENRRLSDAGSSKTCANLLKKAWPIKYPITVTLETDGLATFIDQFGGITLDGSALDGEAANTFLNEGPADELLRIERQQKLMRAYIEKLQSASIVELASSRFAFAPYIDSTLSAGDMLILFTLLRNVDLSLLTFHTLPVDSRICDGIRSYAPDILLIGRMAHEWQRA